MVAIRLNRLQLIIAGVAVLLTVLVIAGFLFSGNSKPAKKTAASTTTTTTLPKKDAQACEFLTRAAMAAGGIVPDVDPKTTDDKKRCTYEDIGGQVNYVTLYVDVASQCQTLLTATNDKTPLPEVSPSAVYSDEMDPTIIVPEADRCYFVQGAKTLVTKDSLTAIAKSITDLFTAVDASTTTTTQSTIVLNGSTVSTLPVVSTSSSDTTIPPLGGD